MFDLLMISAPPCTLPWSPERLQFLRHFYPTLPLACIDAQELKTVDLSILKAPDAPADVSTNLSIQSTCRDMVPNKSNVLTNDDISIEYRQFRLAYEKSEKSQFWSNSFKLLTESAESLNQFALKLRDYLYKQKDVSKRKSTIVCRLLGMLLPNLFRKDRDETNRYPKPPLVEQSSGPSREDTPVTQVPIRKSDDIAITTQTFNHQNTDE